MATVVNFLTRFTDMEGSPSVVSIGGGPANLSTDIYIQGSSLDQGQAGSKRVDQKTNNGILYDNGSGADMSTSDTHLGIWLFVTQYAVITVARIRVGTRSAGDYDDHTFPTDFALGISEYPGLGGWVKIWIDLSRTAEGSNGTLDLASVQYVGPIFDMPNVDGAADNVIFDAIEYGTSCLTLTGITGEFGDFVAYDETEPSNRYGVVNTLGDVIYAKGRIQLAGTTGDIDSLTFEDRNKSIVFPEQTLVAEDWMGITCNLASTKTDIIISNTAFTSPGSVKGDFICSGTNGTGTFDGLTLSELRRVELQSKVTLSNSAIISSNTGALNGATVDGCVVTDTLLISDDPGLISSTEFVAGTDSTGHGLEITATGEYTLNDVTWTNFGASGTTEAAIFNDSSGSLTLNIVGGSTPTFRNGTNASTTLVINPSTLTLVGVVSGSEVRIYDTTTNEELYGVETTDGITDPAYTYTDTGVADIVVHNIEYEYLRVNDVTLGSSDSELPIAQVFDRNYENPD